MMSEAMGSMASALPGPLAVFERILVAVDLSPASHPAVKLALALRDRLGSAVCVFTHAEYSANDEFLRGIGGTETQGDLVGATTERLQRFVENIAPGAGPATTTRAAVAGDLAHATALEAQRWHATLVIATAPSRATILRSHEEKLARELDVPLLMLKHD